VLRGDRNSDDATFQEEASGSLAQGATGSGANATGVIVGSGGHKASKFWPKGS
jgi:hypothetical protein